MFTNCKQKKIGNSVEWLYTVKPDKVFTHLYLGCEELYIIYVQGNPVITIFSRLALKMIRCQKMQETVMHRLICEKWMY